MCSLWDCGQGSILQLNKTRIVFTICAPPPPAQTVAVVTTHFSPPPPPRHGVLGVKNLQLIFDSGNIKLQEGVTVAIQVAWSRCRVKLPARANECGDGSSFPGRAPGGQTPADTAHSLQLITFLAFYTSAGRLLLLLPALLQLVPFSSPGAQPCSALQT